MNALYFAAHDVALLAQGAQSGPVGPEFGKASPIGLLILALMGVAVLFAGWNSIAATHASAVAPCLHRTTASILSMTRLLMPP